MWIALLVKTVSSERNMKVFIRFWFCLVVGLDIRPVFDLWVMSRRVFTGWLVVVCGVWSSGQIQPLPHAALLFSHPLSANLNQTS